MESSVFQTYARYPITLVKGEGSRVWDDRGKEYLDFMSGIAVAGLGHAHPRLVRALMEQASALWHVSNLFVHPNHERLASMLTSRSCADLVFFANSGAEANEAAIKLARRYHNKVLGTGRHEIITFHQSFHGRTLATLTATGQDKVKEGFAPLPEGFRHVPFNDAAALRSAVGGKTAAIMLEMVQGEGGLHVASPEFVREIAALCKEHGLLLVVDEIQTGLGRTGRMFAYEHYGIEPDIVTMAKGLGNGIPIGAMLGKAKLGEAFSAGSHGSTFGGNLLATAVAAEVIAIMEEDNLIERAARLGDRLLERLRAALAGHPFVRDVRGRGLMVGIECAAPVAELVKEAQRRGLLVITAGPNVLRLLPALTIAEDELDRGADILSELLLEQPVTAASV